MAQDKFFTGFFNSFVKRFVSEAGSSRLASSANRSLSLRWYLVLLVAGTLLPVVLFGVAIGYKLSIQEQAASERRIILATRNLASTVESELSSTIRTLQALAASDRLAQNDLKNFHREAERVVKTQPSWFTIILLSPNGQQVTNTLKPFGWPLPKAGQPESLRRVVETNQPTVGDLSPSILTRNLTGVPVRIPVTNNNKLQYILTAVISQKAIAKVVNEQTSVDGEWTRTVVDGRGIVVARTRNPERFVGQRGTPSFLKRIGETSEGIYQDKTLEGTSVYVAFRRVNNSPWTVAVTVPVEVIQAPLRQAMGFIIGSGLALLLLSGVGAFLLSRQISRSITSAAKAAEALAKGECPQISPLSIKEVVLLGRSLEFSANLLSQREQERTANLKRAEAAREEAEAANRIKDEFLAVLSHELRTPLNPILGWSQLLRSGRLDPAKTDFALETIERNAKLQTQLIEDLLDVSRIMRGKLSLHTTPVDLVSTIASAIETIRLAAEAKSIQVETHLDSTIGPIVGDSARLQQVVWNLLSNAVKFTPTGGKISVRLEPVLLPPSSIASSPQLLNIPSYARITVIDTGKGIHPNFLPHVFDYFRQEDGKTTRQFGGLGLGLAIVRHLVELHGGTVRVNSPGEGQGAVFTVDLPFQPSGDLKNQESEQALTSPSLPSPLADLRVLLVDDDEDTRNVITFILEQHRAIVSSVASAQEALQAFESAEFDILISDIGMPDIDGYMLIRQIRSQFAQPSKLQNKLLAIALTAYAGEYDQKQALEAGFQLHLSKPVEPEALISAIVDLLTTHQGNKSSLKD